MTYEKEELIMDYSDYKVWDIDKKKWCGDDIALLALGGDLVRIDNSFKWKWVLHGNYTIVFSTGMRDRTGKEIYDLDLISYRGFFCIVKFEKGSFCLQRSFVSKPLCELLCPEGIEVLGSRLEQEKGWTIEEEINSPLIFKNGSLGRFQERSWEPLTNKRI